MGFYQRRYSEKFGTRTQNNEQNRTEQNNKRTEDDKTENVLNNFDQSEVASGSTNEKKTTISKFSEKLRQKMKRSKSRDTLSSSNRFTFEKTAILDTGPRNRFERVLDHPVSAAGPRPETFPYWSHTQYPTRNRFYIRVPNRSRIGPGPKPVPNSNSYFSLAPIRLIQISSHHQRRARQNRKLRASPPVILPI